jgi:hypothetical protein
MFRAGNVDGQRKRAGTAAIFSMGIAVPLFPRPRLKKGAEVSFCGGPAKPERGSRSTFAAVVNNRFRHKPRKLRGFVLLARLS